MDKLAPAIAWSKENKFWLINGFLLLLMVGLWYSVTGNLNKEFKDNLSTINSKTTLAKGILRKKPDDLTDPKVSPIHPNRFTEEGMKAELKRTVDSIIEAWHLRVKAQKKLLVFPAVLENDRFAEAFEQYNPPEIFPTEYSANKTISGLLTLYRRRIPLHMINICGKDGVRTNWRWDPENYPQDESSSINNRLAAGIADFGESTSVPAVEDEDASRFAVIWSKRNQALWHDKLTKFQGRDDNNKNSPDPTPLQAYMLQQDLWVLEAMFNVIREINGDSTATDTSAIKRIDHIGIGREGTPHLVTLHPVDSRLAPDVKKTAEPSDATGTSASSTLGSFLGGGSSSGGASEFEVSFSEEEVVDPGAETGFGTASGAGGLIGGALEERFPPFHEMYVDTKLEPISSEQVLAVVKGTELSDKNLELLIAKRLPVRIGLKMDEREIPAFMAACVNSPFAYEIQQVRINRHTPGGDVIPLGGAGGTSTASIPNSRDSATTKFDEVPRIETRTNYDVDVEFFGIIKIYNPVRADLIREAAGIKVEPQPGQNDSAAIRNSSSKAQAAS